MIRKQQKRTIETRAKLLDAAREIEAGTGLDSITADAVAKAAGVAKGTVFAHFGDMDGLLSHLLIERLEALHSAMQSGAGPQTGMAPLLACSSSPQEDPVGGLTGMMMAFVETITESDAMMRVFLANTGVTKPTCAEEFVPTLDRLDAGLVTYLKAWRTNAWQPLLRTDRSYDEILEALIAFMIYSAILVKSHRISDMAALSAKMRRHVEAYLLEG